MEIRQKDEAATCIICGSTNNNRKLQLRENRMGIADLFEYSICSRCKLVKLINKPENINLYYQNYSYYKKNKAKINIIDRLYKKIASVLLKPMDRYHPGEKQKNDFILDVGCATGIFLSDLKRNGFRNLIGIDVSQEAVNNKVDEDLEILCSTPLDFKTPKLFDLITLHHVFEHFERPYETLCRLRSLLKYNGLLVISFPNYNSLARILFGAYWPGYDAPRHYFVYNPRNFNMLCEKAGLKLFKIKYISRPSQFLGAFQYIFNNFSKNKKSLEEGFFRNSKILDLLFYIPSCVLNFLRFGDMIELYIKKS